jgi:hypothetical protein
VSARSFLSAIWRELGGQPELVSRISFTESGRFGGVFPVTDLAAASIAAAGLSVSELVGLADSPPAVHVDTRLSSLWFGKSLHPIGWQVPPLWDAIAGDYQAADGWIRLHTNAPHHRAAALRVLDVQADKGAVTAAVRTWPAQRLETEVVTAAGCAAAMRTQAEWRSHAQGQALSDEPLIHCQRMESGAPGWSRHSTARPLQGIRVLDLTRVLAGPVGTRFLAGLGAHVLRLDPPEWNEDPIVPEMTIGKRCARLNLRTPDGKEKFAGLLAGANVLVHGYRPGALDRLGFSERERRAIRPGLVDVCLDAYGWTGPWKGRRGFDSLVQMSSGIAATGMQMLGRERPTPLPVQALDHATGYMIGAAAVRGLREQAESGRGSIWRLSLARTAGLLTGSDAQPIAESLASPGPDDMSNEIEQTSWGPARRLRPPLTISGTPLRWDSPARGLGSASPCWA